MRLRLLDTGKLDAFDAAKLQEAPAKRKGSGLSALIHAFAPTPPPPDPSKERWQAQEEEKPDGLEPVGSVAISNDGKQLVVGGQYGSLARYRR